MKGMKNLIRMFVIAAGISSLTACSESEYDIPNLFPEQYHKILYVLNSGQQNVILYKTGSDTEYQFSVKKAGSEPDLTAEVNMRVMTQEEIDTKYSDLEGIPYKVIPSSVYTIKDTNLKFASTDEFRLVNLTINPEAVEQFMIEQAENRAKFILPIIAEGVNGDSINSLKNHIMLNFTEVIQPRAGFRDYKVDVLNMDYNSRYDINEDLVLTLDVDNQWDFTCDFEVDEDYVDAYNVKNNTNFKLLPTSNYSFDQTIAFNASEKNGKIHLNAQFENIEPGDYMLPIKMAGLEGMDFGIDGTRSAYILAAKVIAPKLENRKDWKWVASSEEKVKEGANGFLTAAYDGNGNSYWHTKWDGGKDPAPWIITIDMLSPKTIYNIGMEQRHDGSNQSTKSGFFEVSDDGKSWTKVGTFFMVQKLLETQIFPIVPTETQHIRITIDQSYKDVVALAEINVYGL